MIEVLFFLVQRCNPFCFVEFENRLNTSIVADRKYICQVGWKVTKLKNNNTNNNTDNNNNNNNNNNGNGNDKDNDIENIKIIINLVIIIVSLANSK